jgi:RNA polymerase sigma factor (sigma-70 family)
MPRRTASLLPRLRRVVGRPKSAEAPDAELLARYVRLQDQGAFADLVARHGPMVLGVCRRLLADRGAAEDAFQAAFLVLARRAASLRPTKSLAAWLSGVAYRVALKARTAARRRPSFAPLSHDPPDRRADLLAEVSVRELLSVLEEEVARLPDVYRLPVLLCCFEGLSQEEAARRLGWAPGSLQGRLERGRKRLHQRLARRGLALGVALAAVEASHGLAGAAVPTALAGPVVSAAALVAAGQPVPPVVAPAKVVALAEGVVKTMFLTRIKAVLATLLVAATLLAGGTAMFPRPSVAGRPAEDRPVRSARPAPRKPAPPKVVVKWEEKLAMRPQGGRGEQIFCAAISPDGKLVVCGMTRNGKLLDASGLEQTTLDMDHIMTAAFSPDGKVLATGHLESLQLWDVATGTILATLDGKTKNISRVDISRDGKFLVSAETGALRLWDLAAKKEVRRFEPGDAKERVVYSATFSPDGKWLASAEGAAKTVKLWNVATGKAIRTLKAHTEYALAVAFSHDGKVLASSGGEGVVKLWDARSGKELASLEGPVGSGRTLAFSSDGKWLASGGSAERAVRLWDVATRKEVATLKHTKQVWSVAFSRDSKVLVSAGDDAVRLWEARRRLAKK